MPLMERTVRYLEKSFSCLKKEIVQEAERQVTRLLFPKTYERRLYNEKLLRTIVQSYVQTSFTVEKVDIEVAAEKILSRCRSS